MITATNLYGRQIDRNVRDVNDVVSAKVSHDSLLDPVASDVLVARINKRAANDTSADLGRRAFAYSYDIHHVCFQLQEAIHIRFSLGTSQRIISRETVSFPTRFSSIWKLRTTSWMDT